MSTEYVYLQGKVKWFRAHKPDEYNKYKHLLYPNPESLEKIRDLQLGTDGINGIKNVLKKDEDGYCMSFSRAASREIKGKVIGQAPPLILMTDGVTPFKNEYVGNGSDVTTKLAVYTHSTPGGGRARAARWESSKIDNLIPFEGKSEFLDKEEKAARGLDEQPPQLF